MGQMQTLLSLWLRVARYSVWCKTTSGTVRSMASTIDVEMLSYSTQETASVVYISAYESDWSEIFLAAAAHCAIYCWLQKYGLDSQSCVSYKTASLRTS